MTSTDTRKDGPLALYPRLMHLPDVMEATSLDRIKANKLMRKTGIIYSGSSPCVLREELRDYCEREGIKL